MDVAELFRLDGEVAVVTGAGRGIGEGIARVLAGAGASVVLAGFASKPNWWSSVTVASRVSPATSRSRFAAEKNVGVPPPRCSSRSRGGASSSSR